MVARLARTSLTKGAKSCQATVSISAWNLRAAKLRDRSDREVVGHDVRQFYPFDGCRDWGTRARSHRICGCNRAVTSILVVVDKDLLAALLLPPLCRDELRCPTLEFAPEGDRSVTHINEVPPQLNSKINVDPAAAEFWETAVSKLIEEFVCQPSDPHGVGKSVPG